MHLGYSKTTLFLSWGITKPQTACYHNLPMIVTNNLPVVMAMDSHKDTTLLVQS